MLKKIRYRLVWNRAGQLNQRGEGLVQIEMEQAGRRLYLSTHTYLAPGHWQGGMVAPTHPLADGLNTELITQLIDVERVELDYIRQGVYPSLVMVRDAVRDQMKPGAKLADFIREMMQTGQRKPHTRQGYMTLARSIERWHRGLLLTDIDYNIIHRYEDSLRAQNLAHNTIVGRLRQWRAVMSEAKRRRLLPHNPFRRLLHRPHGSTPRLPHRRTAPHPRSHQPHRAARPRPRRLPLLLLHRPPILRPRDPH